MAFITAARHEVAAAVAYHGGDTEKYLGEVGSLRAPLLMHLGEEDEFISKTAQAQIKAALAKKPNATVYSYPGQRHAFSRHNACTTMPRRQCWRTAGQANFSMNTCGDLKGRYSANLCFLTQSAHLGCRLVTVRLPLNSLRCGEGPEVC
jgi:dienelactone hydrolase